MKKIIMAAGIAASMLFATSAFAETTNSIKPDYEPTSGKVTLTGEGVKSRATTTYLVISLGKTAPQGIYAGDITDTMIKQIDQVDVTSTVEEILVGAGLADGFYEVRMGGDGNVAYGVFEVGGTPKTAKRYLGDINNDSDVESKTVNINLADILRLAQHIVIKEDYTLTGDDFTAANVNGEGEADLADMLPIAQYIVSKEPGEYNLGVATFDVTDTN